MKATNRTTPLASTMFALGLLLAGGSAFAEDAMKKDAMGDGMKKEAMSKDCKKDAMGKDCMANDKMKKGGTHKDNMMKKDDMGKDDMKN